MKQQAETDLLIYQQELQTLLNTSDVIVPVDESLRKLTSEVLPDTSAINRNPVLNFQRQKINVAASQLKFERNKYLPDLTFGINRQVVVSGYNPADISRSYFPEHAAVVSRLG